MRQCRSFIRARRRLGTIILALIFCSPLLALAEPKGVVVVDRSQAPAKEPRTALVIGNSKYKTAPLRNPVNDARAVTKALRGLGFQVTMLENATQRRMEGAMDRFGVALRKGGVGLFYYSGHGVQVGGQNYLIPVGAKVRSESVVKYEAVNAGRMLAMMQDAGNPLNIVILDACRDNPFKSAFKSLSRGLATLDAARGTLIAYATAPGKVAADGEGRHSPYTEALIKHLKDPATPIEQVFKRVARKVDQDTGGKQTPWYTSSVLGDFYFAGKPEPSAAEPEPQTAGKKKDEPPQVRRYVGSPRLNVRSGPGTGHPKIGALRRNQQVLVKEIEGGWARVSDPIAGYVAAKYLRESQVEEPPPKPLGPTTLVVDQRGRGDHRTIGAAMQEAPAGSRILIRPGVYRESLYLGKELHLEGTGESKREVIVESVSGACLFSSADKGSVRNVTMRQTRVNQACMNISAGRLLVHNVDLSGGSPVVWVHGRNADPMFRNSRIHDGKTNGVIVTDNGQGRFENNDIFGNEKRNIVVANGGDPLVTGNRIHNGEQNGVDVVDNGKGRFENNDIFGNGWSGFAVSKGGDPVVTGNRIHDGKGNGVIVTDNGKGRFENNDIFGHPERYAGFHVGKGGNPVVTGNRIHDNVINIYKSEGALGTFRDNREY